ncbi:polyribonucleotide nucleotidyltransferase, partial [Oribacterium parvum]|uniref:polyribonucleotide nucleotidyltransferase n=1 Tax=Oribacterium parvum TaxID=1501329 RepID=UPI0028F05090
KAVFTDEKQERDANISALSERLVEAFQDDEEALAILPDAIYQYEKKTVRKMILKDHKRPDGRAINEIRPLESEVDVLPRVHGSAMFKRGQTQILNITTLAPLSEVQKVEGMNEFETEKRYLHQYNFPGYSVGEAKASRGPGRREIGHGALAEKALIPVLPPVEEFPYAIRSVSETMESNGSTSMASTCASCMSLMAAGVPIRKSVAGISCGLVTGESDDEYLVLTDIQGLEDFFGDMDFKVTGTRDGITAIQMDIKIHGLTRPIVEEAIKRAREARLFIMDGVMKDAIAEPRKELSPYAPKIITLQIETDKIGDVIGKQGKTITAIIEETGAKIDIDDSGMVSISGIDLAALERAKEIILSIVNDIEPGQILEGTVVRMMNFGAFVQLSPTKDGMVHISKLSDKRVNEVEDVVHIGDKVRVKVIEVDKMGRINLSMRPQDLAE